MTDVFTAIVTDYLNEKETDYALMINGEWGSGKTFFIKNNLKKKIESVTCPVQKNKDKNVTYKQLYVSLYGVSSIEEINERIFYAINPNLRWIETTASKLLSFVEIIPSVGNTIKNAIPNDKEREDLRNKIANYNDKVIFFDDLERIDKNKIDIQSVLGYINSLTEHNHYKVVVVANDEVLGDDYKQFKEKTIRFSYHHFPKLSDIFDSICEKYEENNQYKIFLNKQKQFILDIISAGRCNNIRTLIFITDVYKKIFERINGDYSNEINQDLLLPFTLISIEAKNGHIKEELKDALQSINSLSFMDFLHNHEQNENKQCTPEEEYKQELNTKYDRFKSDRSIQFYDELFELIYDGYVSPNNWESVITNLRNEYKSKIETEEIKLAKQIINWTQIPDADFSSVVDKVKSNVSENKYHVSDLLRIYAAFIQIEAMNIDGFTLSNDDSRTFKVAIDNSMKDLPYNSLLNMQLPIWDEHNTSETRYNELRQYALDINEKNKEKAKLSEKLDVLDMIRNNDVVKFKNFMSDINNRFVFVEIEPKEIIASIISANAEIKQVLLRGLMGFFPESLSNPPQNDLNYIEKLNTELKNYLSTQTIRKPSLVNLFWIQNYLDQIISLYKIRLNVQ